MKGKESGETVSGSGSEVGGVDGRFELDKPDGGSEREEPDEQLEVPIAVSTSMED